MAQGDEKRTYKLTDEGIEAIQWLDGNTRLDKSDAVDRAVKRYFLAVKEGNVDDALVKDSVDESVEDELPDDSGNGKDGGITDSLKERLR